VDSFHGPAVCVGFSSNQLRRATAVAARFERVIGAVMVNDESQRLESAGVYCKCVPCQPAALSTVAGGRSLWIRAAPDRAELKDIFQCINRVLTIR